MNTIKATTYDYVIAELRLFEYLKIYVYLKDDLGQIIDTKILFMKGNDYKYWSDDDNYVLLWIKSQLQKRYNY